MKAKEIRNLSENELELKYRELTQEYEKLRFSNRLVPVKNPAMIRLIRRDMARILTVIQERKSAS